MRKAVGMGSAYEMVGAVKVVFEPVNFASGFTKREFVLVMEDEYPQDIKFVCVKEKCALLDGLAAGERVKVGFRIRGNEYKERYYVDLQAFKIDRLEKESAPASNSEPGPESADDIPPF